MNEDVVFELKTNLLFIINAFDKNMERNLNANEIIEALEQTKNDVKSINKL